MYFTVAHKGSEIPHRNFSHYLRLLRQRGIDWTDAPRVPSGTEYRWFYVWDNRADAENFCAELREATDNDRWYVRQLPKTADVSRGLLMPIIIEMRRGSLSSSYILDVQIHSALQRRFPDAPRLFRVEIGYETKEDAERINGPMWDQIALMLTGLSAEQLAELGGYVIFDVATEKIVYDSSCLATT